MKRLACIALCLMAAAPGAARAQEQTALQIETGLVSFFTGTNRSAKVTVTELGPPNALSQVRIIYRDSSDRVVARTSGNLRRGQPVVFDLPLDMSDTQVQLRASISITSRLGRHGSPVVVLEDVDANSLAIETRVSCAAPASREGPVTPNCTGGAVTSLTIGG